MKIILFDGNCNVCSASVQFIIKRDPHATFRFASLQSDIGQQLLTRYQVDANLDSMVFLEEGHVFTASSAVLHICKYLPAGWKALSIFLIVPKRIRDFFYGLVAKNRHRFRKENKSCLLPNPEVMKRFLTSEEDIKT